MSWGGQPPNQNPGYNPYGQPAQQPYGGGPPASQYGAPPPGSYAPQGHQAPPPAASYHPPPPHHGQQPPGYGAPPPAGGPGYGAPPGSVPPPGGRPPPTAPGYGGAPPPGPQGDRLPPTAPGGFDGSRVLLGTQHVNFRFFRYGAPAHGGYGAPPAGHAGYGGGYGAPPPQPPPGVSPDLWQWFQAVDQDRSGRITAEELRTALLNGNMTPFNAETCRLMIGMFDRDGRDGKIDIHEFSALWKYIQDWKSCFDRFDTDRSGNINQMELQNAFRTFGYNLSPNFAQLVVLKFDRHQRRSINFDDFIQSCVMLKSLTDAFRSKDATQRGVINIQYEEFLRMVLDNTTTK